MLYKIVENDGIYPEERTISVRPLEKADEQQVRHLVISRLSPYFNGIDDLRAWHELAADQGLGQESLIS